MELVYIKRCLEMEYSGSVYDVHQKILIFTKALNSLLILFLTALNHLESENNKEIFRPKRDYPALSSCQA